MAINAVKIYPPIGIARLGNSPEFYVGSEIPGVRDPPPGGYKDAMCRVKRQAQRFRLYAYDGAAPVKEITTAEADIEWTVHLANKKAAWRMFAGLNDSTSLRNGTVPASDRWTLEIDPGPRTLTGPNEAAAFNTGRFKGKYVPLGEMRTDADGRLIVVGGHGSSGSVPAGVGIVSYANNDDWHDDVSDGPVTAKVTMKDGSGTFTAAPAWVICPPPDFAPGLDSVTTLYDTLYQVAVEKGWLTVPASPSFTNDVYPILQRVLALANVSTLAASGHMSFAPAFPPGGTAAARQAIFARLRDPNDPTNPAPTRNMPRLWDDSNEGYQTITKAQYEIMKKWKDGAFTADWTGSPPAPSATITPDGLTRAALEPCVGAALYPGIEASWFLRSSRPSEYAYSEPFRLDHAGRSAGDVTKQMAVPWQADFLKCYAYSDGSWTTLAWWPAQRPDDVVPEGGGAPVAWIREIVSTHEDMVEHWHKLGFVVKKGGQYVETERHKVCESLILVTDRSHYSQDEVTGALAAPPARFDEALFVIAEGFLPTDLGIAHKDPTEAELAAFAPAVTIQRTDSTPVPDMKAVAAKLYLEDESLPAGLRQRCTFAYRIEFSTAEGFKVGGTVVESQTLTAIATKAGRSSSAPLVLFTQPNPYMVDGETSWLSTDVRVFRILEAEDRFGFTMGSTAADATAFIKNVVDDFNTKGAAAPYGGISDDQQTSTLELSEKIGTKRVFNFAVARVRYRGSAIDAEGVRVFFRLFTTAATGLDYSLAQTYRRSISPTAPISLLGLQAGEIVTIPFYGDARVDTATSPLTAQVDGLNVRDLVADAGNEVYAYFGCWLDFNQTTLRFPNHPTPKDGSWATGRKSIQELIRGLHQCLVAEVFFPNDPIPDGATPAANDNLAQRNLAIVESDNPGPPESHVVAHTFEIKATRPRPPPAPPAEPMPTKTMMVEVTPRTPGTELAAKKRGRGRQALPPGGEQVMIAATAPPASEPDRPDELMIRWGDLPRTTRATLYMPDVQASETMRYVEQNHEAVRLEAVDAHTLLCKPGGVTFVPIPRGRERNVPALLTLELPQGIKRGQVFRVVVQQLSQRRVLGAFQLTIPVSDAGPLLEPEMRRLSVLRHIAKAIPTEDPWRLVFGRWLDQVAGRVRGFGGDPDTVAPSPDGNGRTRPGGPQARDVHADDLFCLNIPWDKTQYEGDLTLRIRFRSKGEDDGPHGP